MIDMSETITPKSDQLNADDLIAGPITITIADVRRAETAEQPIAINWAGGRPYMPCKSMRRVLVHVLGNDGGKYVGHRLTLYRDPAVKFGGLAVGGIRISHMTGISKPVTVALAETRASRKPFTVQPLAAEAQPAQQQPALSVAEWGRKLAADLDACTDQDAVDRIAARDDVQDALKTAPDGVKTRINALISAAITRVAPAVTAPADDDDGWPGPKVGEAA